MPGQPTIGTVPQGWAATQDPQTGEWSMAPIKGGPEAQKADDQAASAESKDEQRRTWNLIVNDEIGRALNIIEGGGWLPTTGLGSDLAAGVGGTAARDLKGLLDTVKANAGFDRLQAMRDASPTGGALGQVSERELAFLQSTIGNLEQSQSKEQITYNLKRLQKIYQNMLDGKRAYDGLLSDNGASGGWQDAGDGIKIRRLD
jgi:alpha-mannosidase